MRRKCSMAAIPAFPDRRIPRMCVPWIACPARTRNARGFRLEHGLIHPCRCTEESRLRAHQNPWQQSGQINFPCCGLAHAALYQTIRCFRRAVCNKFCTVRDASNRICRRAFRHLRIRKTRVTASGCTHAQRARRRHAGWLRGRCTAVRTGLPRPDARTRRGRRCGACAAMPACRRCGRPWWHSRARGRRRASL